MTNVKGAFLALKSGRVRHELFHFLGDEGDVGLESIGGKTKLDELGQNQQATTSYICFY